MKTIGIVEDDRLLNEALAKMLEKNGYQPLQAHTLEEGMKLIRQKPELIILDINLPDGEGTRICQAAREYSRIPVLFLTARDLEEDMIQEEGKYYIAIRAVHGRESYEKECFYCFGKQLIMDCSPVLLEYLDKEYRKYEKIRKTLQNGTKEHIRKRREEVEQRLDDIKEALGYYEM